MGSTRQTTITNGKWNAGTCSGSGIDGVRFEPFRVVRGEGKVQDKYIHPSCYGQLFPTQEAASTFALEHGFTQVYYGRPSAFITLKLSPATRHYLKSITDYTARWDALEKVLSKTLCIDGGRYFQSIRCAPFAAKTRAEWNLYLDGDFEQLRQVCYGKLAHEAVLKRLKQILGDAYAEPTSMPLCRPCSNRHMVRDCPCAQFDRRHPELPDTYSHVCGEPRFLYPEDKYGLSQGE